MPYGFFDRQFSEVSQVSQFRMPLAIVTGANSGIGHAMAKVLIKDVKSLSPVVTETKHLTRGTMF